MVKGSSIDPRVVLAKPKVSVLDALTTEAVTLHNHVQGITPANFASSGAGSVFRSLATNTDRKGKEFVSTMEAASGAPIYGVQWHPERNAYRLRCILVTIRICIG